MVALYQNTGGGAFKDVTAVPAGSTGAGGVRASVSADYDNDGFEDVYITAFGADALWRNTSKGTFVDVTRRAGLEESRWGTSCAFADYDRDGDLDLYVANYVRFDENTIPGRGTTVNCRFMATDVFCGPKQLTGDADVLYRNNGDGTFADVTTSAGIDRSGLLRLRRCLRRSERRLLAGHLRGERLGAEPDVPQPRQRHVRGGGSAIRRRVERRWTPAGRNGRRCRRLQRRRPARPHRDELLPRLQHAVRERARRHLHGP